MRTIKRQRKKIAGEVAASIKQGKAKPPSVEFLNSGCTISNLALSGKGRKGGWARGRVCNIVGDGSSGKTVCALELAFWCFKNIKKTISEIYPKVKNIKIVYNNCEGVMDFPMEKMFGNEFVDSVEWICIKEIEKMSWDWFNRLKGLKSGDFLLYIIDSWDALFSIADKKRFEKSVEDEKEEEGSYNLEKQKFVGKFFSNCCDKLENNKLDATLFIISQVRTKIGITFGKKTYRAGGKALDFYTHQVAWIAEEEKMTKTKGRHKRVYGIRSRIKVERSKVAKPFREASFRILYDYGIDDINSMVDFLYGKNEIRFEGQKFKTRDSFVKYVEENNLEEKLMAACEKEWQDIEGLFEKEVETRKPRH